MSSESLEAEIWLFPSDSPGKEVFETFARLRIIAPVRSRHDVCLKGRMLSHSVIALLPLSNRVFYKVLSVLSVIRYPRLPSIPCLWTFTPTPPEFTSLERR